MNRVRIRSIGGDGGIDISPGGGIDKDQVGTGDGSRYGTDYGSHLSGTSHIQSTENPTDIDLDGIDIGDIIIHLTGNGRDGPGFVIKVVQDIDFGGGQDPVVEAEIVDFAVEIGVGGIGTGIPFAVSDIGTGIGGRCTGGKGDVGGGVLGGGVRSGRVHTVVDVQGLVGRRKGCTVDGVGEKMPLSRIDTDGGRDINTVKGAGECTGVGTGGTVEERDTGPDPGNIEDGASDGLISDGIKPPGKRDTVAGTC